MMNWKQFLKEAVKKSGQSGVARELDVSPSMVAQVLNGTYKASTERFARRVKAIYGNGGLVSCPVRGDIEPIVCADTYRRAKSVGLNVGNNATFRQHSTCLKCQIRG